MTLVFPEDQAQYQAIYKMYNEWRQSLADAVLAGNSKTVNTLLTSAFANNDLNRVKNDKGDTLILPHFFGHQHLNFYTANSTSIGAL